MSWPFFIQRFRDFIRQRQLRQSALLNRDWIYMLRAKHAIAPISFRFLTVVRLSLSKRETQLRSLWQEYKTFSRFKIHHFIIKLNDKLLEVFFNTHQIRKKIFLVSLIREIINYFIVQHYFFTLLLWKLQQNTFLSIIFLNKNLKL